MNTKSKFILSVLFSLTSLAVMSQCKEWKWPEDKKTAEEKLVLLHDAMNNKKYRQAISPLNWLITNSPQINTAIYIHAANLYDALARLEKDPQKKRKYADSLMTVYDLRIKNCGEREAILNRKAMSAVRYYVNGAEAEMALVVMDTAFAVNKNEVTDAALLPYMQLAVVVKSKFKKLSEEDLLTRYENITKIIEAKSKIVITKKDQNAIAKLKKTQKEVDEWLFKIVKPDCDFVLKNLAPKFKQDPEDVNTAKRIFGFMLKGKCTDQPLWLEAGQVIFTKEKDFGLGKNLALRFLALENNDKAELYFNESLPLATSKADSSEIYYYMGAIEAKKQDKIKSRAHYKLAAILDATRTEAYERIGDLYYSSFNECAQKQRQADDRAVYLAAYEYYAKAKNQKKMSMAKQAFPSKEEIFLLNYKVGDKLKVNCWINEEVVIRTRD